MPWSRSGRAGRTQERTTHKLTGMDREEFYVIYIDGTGSTGSVVVSYGSYDIIGITREVHRQLPDADVRCIIPRKR